MLPMQRPWLSIPGQVMRFCMHQLRQILHAAQPNKYKQTFSKKGWLDKEGSLKPKGVTAACPPHLVPRSLLQPLFSHYPHSISPQGPQLGGRGQGENSGMGCVWLSMIGSTSNPTISSKVISAHAIPRAAPNWKWAKDSSGNEGKGRCPCGIRTWADEQHVWGSRGPPWGTSQKRPKEPYLGEGNLRKEFYV